MEQTETQIGAIVQKVTDSQNMKKLCKKSAINVKRSICRDKPLAQSCQQQQHSRMATKKRLWHCHLPLIMWDIGTKLIFSGFGSKRNFFKKIWVSDMTDFLAGLIPMPLSNVLFQAWTWGYVHCTMASWSACLVVPRQISGLGRNQGKTHKLITFLLPHTLNRLMFMNQKEPGEVQIFYWFTAR